MQGKSASTGGKGKFAAKRRGYGFAHAGGILGKRIRETSGARGFAETRLLTQWPEIVGQAIAGIARPVKVSYARKGMGARLTLLAVGASAPEIQMQIPRIKERVNACYGYNAVSDIHITQTSQTGFAEAQTAFSHDIPEPERKLSTAQTSQLESQISSVGDEKLRALLGQLGRKIMTET